MIITLPMMIIAMSMAAQDAGWDLMTNTSNAFYICSVQQAVRLDDHRTSPEIIARGAMRACSQEARAYESAFRAKAQQVMAGVPVSETEPLLEKQLEEHRQDVENLTIQAILEQRTTKRAKNR